MLAVNRAAWVKDGAEPLLTDAASKISDRLH
jgi:hypothetical protein